MLQISKVSTTAPVGEYTSLVGEVYALLDKLKIPYQQAETEEVITMVECAEINKALDVEMVKSVFLCNQKKTSFFLLITTEDKQFETKRFSSKLGVSHLSFASPELMEKYLGVKPGAATIMGVLKDEENYVQVIIDKDVAEKEWYGCSSGSTKNYMKIKTKQLLNVFLPYAGHKAKIISI